MLNEDGGEILKKTKEERIREFEDVLKILEKVGRTERVKIVSFDGENLHFIDSFEKEKLTPISEIESYFFLDNVGLAELTYKNYLPRGEYY